MTYAIGQDSRSITCHTCGKTSYNLNDVANLYCGHCNAFHPKDNNMNITKHWTRYADEHIEDHPDESPQEARLARLVLQDAFFKGAQAFAKCVREMEAGGEIDLQSLSQLEGEVHSQIEMIGAMVHATQTRAM